MVERSMVSGLRDVCGWSGVLIKKPLRVLWHASQAIFCGVTVCGCMCQSTGGFLNKEASHTP